MSVDRNEKIWAWSSTGNKMHAYLGGNPGSGLRVALCRSNITRPADAVVQGLDDLKFRSAVCPNCLKKAEAMWDRAEASMAPATEAKHEGSTKPTRWSYRFVTRHYSGRLVSSSRGYLEADSEAEAKAKVAALPMDPDFYAEGITVAPAN